MLFDWFKKKPSTYLKDIDFDKEDVHALPTSTELSAKKVVPEYVTVKTSTLYIDLGYVTVNWFITPYEPKEDEELDEVWAEFITWFNHTLDEPYFIMTTQFSQRLFARRDIRGYTIEVTSKKVLKEDNAL